MLSADLLNFLVPTPTNQIGQLSLFDHLSGRFNSGLASDEGAFLTWPLILLTVLFARRCRHELRGKLMLNLLAIILACSLGPELVIKGQLTSIALPWAAFQMASLKNVAPVRLCVYAFMIFAILTSFWFSETIVRPVFKFVFASAIFVCMLPNLSASYWAYPANTPAFFSSGLYRHYLSSGQNVFILPFWPRNESMLWQARTGMYFRIAQGPGPWPLTVGRWPIMEAFVRKQYVPDAATQFRAYLTTQGVSTVIAADYSLQLWEPLLSTLQVVPVKAGGVSIYKLTSGTVPLAKAQTLDSVRARFDYERFNYFVTRVHDYLEGGGSLDDLIATDSVKLGLLPGDAIIGPPAPSELRDRRENWDRRSNLCYGMILFVTNKDLIVIGEQSWAPSARLLLRKYRGIPEQAQFAPTQGVKFKQGDELGFLVMAFNRHQLNQAASVASGLLDNYTPIQTIGMTTYSAGANPR
jgi:hypothetical protein